MTKISIYKIVKSDNKPYLSSLCFYIYIYVIYLSFLGCYNRFPVFFPTLLIFQILLSFLPLMFLKC
jgi:hypothetical protein